MNDRQPTPPKANDAPHDALGRTSSNPNPPTPGIATDGSDRTPDNRSDRSDRAPVKQ